MIGIVILLYVWFKYICIAALPLIVAIWILDLDPYIQQLQEIFLAVTLAEALVWCFGTRTLVIQSDHSDEEWFDDGLDEMRNERGWMTPTSVIQYFRSKSNE